MRNLLSRLPRLRGRQAADWALAAEAVLALARARRHVAATPFEGIARLLSRPAAPHAAPDAEAARRQGQRIGRLAARMAQLVPFEAHCLAQAIAVQALLRRRGIAGTVHFGAKPGAEARPFTAHAWVTVAGAVVVGGASSAANHTEIARFGAAAPCTRDDAASNA